MLKPARGWSAPGTGNPARRPGGGGGQISSAGFEWFSWVRFHLL